MWDEGAVRRFAADNHGLVDRQVLLAHGATDDVIKAHVAAGRWVQVQWGVYYLNVTEQTWLAEIRAALLAAGPHALASHRTAAALWHFDGITSQLIELTVPYENRALPNRAILHRTRRRLPNSEVEGVPVTTVERTLLDLSGLLSDRVMEKMYMSALRLKLTCPDEVSRVVREQGGRGVRGTRRLLRVMSIAGDALSGSAAEVDAARLMRDAGIPQPVAQLKVRLPNGGHAYPDFAWPDLMKVVEIDGLGAHSTPDQLSDDLFRQNMLMELGWEIRRFTARQLWSEPKVVQGEIRSFVGR